MQSIVIDTNVMVSSLIQRGYSYHIVHELFIEDKFQLCISDPVMEEYYEVLARPRFGKFTDFFIRAESLLADIELNAKKFFPSIEIDFITDKDDNIFLELADECKADFIITGNTTDFTFTMYKQIRIVTPKEYWEHYQPR